MSARSWHLALFSLCLFFSSGLGTAKILKEEENRGMFSSSELGTQLDDIPVVNPTTPGTENPYPTVNPTSPQAPDTSGQDPTTPTTTPTTPNTNPTTPASPQAPDTSGQNPTTPTTTPTTPNTNPTTPTSPQAPDTSGQNPTTPTTTPTTPNTNPTTPTSSGGQWCVANQGASDTALQVALDYACGFGGADCSAIQPGASCYNPSTVRDHASYAFNDYYQKNPTPTSCVFGGTATLTSNDPSSGNCHYAASRTPSLSPPYVSPPSPPAPMTPTPPSTTMPGGSTVYGSEPTGSPNAATSISYSLLLLLFTCGLLASLQVANYI